MATAYKRIFEYKKRHLHDNEAIGVVSLSFEITADLLFLETDSVKLINRISSLRPRAYLCVFSDNPSVKNLTAINFGVYTFPRHFIKNPEEFVNTIGRGFVKQGKALILQLETNDKEEIVNHKVMKVAVSK